MSIGTRLFLIFSVVILLLGSVVASMTLLSDSIKKTTETERRRYEFRKLAEELRHSSDDLTRMARTYVVTGDPIYEAYYYEMLAIRTGAAPRPTNYDGIYWDYVTATHERPDTSGKPEALVDLMKNTGITSLEFAKLREAVNNSIALTTVEMRAFAAMKGRFPGEWTYFGVQGEPDPKLARDLLHNHQYHVAKAAIMRPIGKFFELVDARTRGELAANQHDQDFYRQLTAALVGLTITFSIFAFLHLRKRIITPIVTLSGIAERARPGQTCERAVVICNDEIGTLARSFNVLSGKIDEAILQLERMSTSDGLTQIPNRRHFDSQLSHEWRRCGREGKPLSLLMIDIDFFKRLNDTAGHLAGDDCLKRIASILVQQARRAGDVVARYGGEEFAIILPNTERDDAMVVSERVRWAMEVARIAHPDSAVGPHVTVSTGVATVIPTRDSNPMELVGMADEALYQAKHDGRNCTRSYRTAPAMNTALAM